MTTTIETASLSLTPRFSEVDNQKANYPSCFNSFPCHLANLPSECLGAAVKKREITNSENP
jgi:hypothetical protein